MICLLGLAAAMIACGCQQKTTAAAAAAPAPSAPQTISITSTAFGQGQRIPARYTYDGAGVSPPLAWTNLPPKTVALALIVQDPDAPSGLPFGHWILADLPPTLNGLKEGVTHFPKGVIVGKNDFGDEAYGGPAPPPDGKTHHYHFRIFALDARLNLQAGPSRDDLLNAMQGHILAEGDLMGTYNRPPVGGGGSY
jgi:Raf kinase inhibitor-like YbhB/YbcL family protein